MYGIQPEARHGVACMRSSSGLGASTPRRPGALRRAAAAQVLGLDGRVLRQVACGWRHSVVVDVDGTVYTFGWSKYGQLGHGDCQCAPPPAP